jgi:hypothetical protein
MNQWKLIPYIMYILQFLIAKDRTILAGIILAQPTMATLTQTAGHILLHR